MRNKNVWTTLMSGVFLERNNEKNYIHYCEAIKDIKIFEISTGKQGIKTILPLSGKAKLTIQFPIDVQHCLYDIFNDDTIYINWVECGRMDVFNNANYQMKLTNFNVVKRYIPSLHQMFSDEIVLFEITVECDIETYVVE